jgi:hypothetical protein
LNPLGSESATDFDPFFALEPIEKMLGMLAATGVFQWRNSFGYIRPLVDL